MVLPIYSIVSLLISHTKKVLALIGKPYHTEVLFIFEGEIDLPFL